PLGMQTPQHPAGAPTELVQGMTVSGNLFQVLGVEPAIGRLFPREKERAPSAAPYVVLNYNFWQSRFGGSPAILGQALRLNGYPMTVVGVTRRGFRSIDVSSRPALF